MMTNFDIDALRAVVFGIEHGSFSRAAVELGRSQSAVSMQLKKLEQQAGVQLFTRKGRTCETISIASRCSAPSRSSWGICCQFALVHA